MKPIRFRTAKCPVCGQIYHDPPALSRKDNKTLICPDCGTREALEGLGIDEQEREQIISTVHKYTRTQ